MIKKTYIKSSIRVKHFKTQGFKTKEEFIAYIETTRSKRSANNPFKYPSKHEILWKHIPKENKQKISNIIFNAIGYPSRYEVDFRPGSPQKSNYNGLQFDGTTYGGWSQKSAYFTFFIPHKIKIEVASFEGLNNLYCKKIKIWNGITVYQASWIVKKRGYDFDIVSGYVAAKHTDVYYASSVAYHSDTIKNAVIGLQKKLKKQIKKEIKADTILNISKFQKITGACNDGIENFLNQHNIDKTVKMTAQEAIKFLNANNENYYAQKIEKALK